jgi:type II secretory pathway pseudopilin PulG
MRKLFNNPVDLSRSRCGAMSLIETLLIAVVITGLLGGLVMVSASLASDGDDARTRDALKLLHQAMEAYNQTHDQPLTAADTAEALGILSGDPTSAPMMRRLAITRNEQGVPGLRDGYGSNILYQSPATDIGYAGRFVSPGADGQLGDPYATASSQRRAAADNIYSGELEVLK